MAGLQVVQDLVEIYPAFRGLKTAKTKMMKTVYVEGILQHCLAKNVLFFALDPMVTTHIGESFRLLTTSDLNYEPYRFEDDPSLETILEYLKNNPVNNNVKRALCEITDAIDYNEVKDFWLDLITQQLSLGITAKTVNQIVGNDVIPVFGVMLAEKYFSYPTAVQNKRFYITEKLDGCRAFVTVEHCRDDEEPEIHIYSRTGRPYDGLVDIEHELYWVARNEKRDFYLDGELIITNRDAMPSKEAFKQTSQILRTDGEKHGITFNVFDYLSRDEWIKKKGTRPYWARREWLDDMRFFSDAVKIVPVLYSGTDVEQIYRCHDDEKAKQHEGIMINLSDAVYEFKRTKSLLKVKTMNDVDLKVVGANRGIGRNFNTLGSLIVDFDGTEVAVGSGFTQNERDYIWADVNSYIGRIAIIQYFEVITNKDGTKSLRFPIFKGWRNDVDVPGKDGN